MSLAGAINNAFSGLKSNTRIASIISSNVANAANEFYGRREVMLSTNVTASAGGVRVDGIQRHVDQVLLNDKWMSDAETDNARTMMTFASALEISVGTAGSAGSLMDRLAAFENALISAAANPASNERLETVAHSAAALTVKMNAIAVDLQDLRRAAEQSIVRQVADLNSQLSRIHVLNDSILQAEQSGANPESLLDEQQKQLDAISQIVPIRVVQREKGTVALFTARGAVLLDGPPAVIGFVPNIALDAGKTHQSGDLAGLTYNGKPISVSEEGMFAGGSLAAQFFIRDEAATDVSARLDGVAADLAERLGPNGPDGSLSASDAGFFTDAGVPFDAVNETGFAARITVNPLVAPGSSTLWKIRDGLLAQQPDVVGDATLIQGLAQALDSQNVPESAALNQTGANLSQHVTGLMSRVASQRVTWESELSFREAQNTTLKEMHLAQGVDTDAELQRLLLVEQHYAANAQVLTTIDEMMQRLLAI